MPEATAQDPDQPRRRWNTDANPAAEGDQFATVEVINFVVKMFRRARSKFRGQTSN